MAKVIKARLAGPDSPIFKEGLQVYAPVPRPVRPDPAAAISKASAVEQTQHQAESPTANNSNQPK